MELLQIPTAQFITKCDGQLLQIETAYLLQSATRFITNCDRYYKVRWIYYKLRQVLQSAMIITNCDSTNAATIYALGTRGNHRLKNAFDMRSELFPGRPQIFTGFYE